MSVTRRRAEAIEQAAVRRSGHVKMGVCPVCEQDITSNQRTAHRIVDGTVARIHATHLADLE